MSRTVPDIEADIVEVKQLVLSAKRPTNQSVLAKHLSSLKTQLENLKATIPEPVKVEQQPEPIKQKKPSVSYTPLTKYSWEQQGNKIKIYFSLEGIGKQVTADDIDVQFEKQAVSVKIRKYKNKNLIFAIPKLNGTLDVESCKYLLKTNTLSLTMFKKQNKNWSDLSFKEDKFSKKPKEDEGMKGADPSAGLMDMMKKMYEDGDDNMKRTIAEAWSKAQDKKSGSPLDDPL